MAKKANPRSGRSDELELEKAYHKVAEKKKKKKKHGGVAVLFCVVTIVALLSVLAGCFSTTELEDGIIMDGVRIAGIDVGGMTKEEALTALTPAISDYEENTMVVSVLDQQVELSPSLTEISLDAQAAVDAAYELGRSGSRTARKEQQLKALTTGLDTDLSACLYVNREAIVAKLNTLEIAESSKLSQSKWTIEGKKPDLTQEEAPTENQTLVITLGTPAYKYDQQALVEMIVAAYHSGDFQVSYDSELTEPDPIDLDAIYEENYIAPVEPEMDSETFEVSAHAYGYEFNLEEAKLALSEAAYGDVLEIPFVPIAPTQTQEGLSSMLFRDTLSSHSAYYSSGYNRATNLRLACEALNGTIVMPGETLSYNNTLGERTAAKGYLPAASYVAGKTEDTLGGGICQPSSVLYYCVLLADLEVVERYCHQYFCTYMDPGMDATVFWGGVDFKFRNNTDYPLRVDAHAEGGTVSIELVGTDTKDYYVDMEYEYIATYGWDTEYVEFTKDNNPKGYKDGETITSPYTGYKYNTYKCKYSKADDSLIERTFEAVSSYDSRNKVVAKDVTPEETEPPTEPTAPPTEPPVPPTEPPAPPTEPTAPPAPLPSDPPAPPTEPTVPPEPEVNPIV